MKKILITGKDSYIGTSLESWLSKEPDTYKVDTLDMKNDLWKEKDFSSYDVVFHVAGIAHIKETKQNKSLYYKVNRDLAYETAKKAKSEDVSQFIFLSSMSVYGLEKGVINKETPLNAKNAYGRSKIEAEELINKLEDDSFKVATLRPPMIYGKGCKGNYPRLASMAIKLPIFPEIDNKRSMIYVDNLSEFIKLIIDDCNGGLFFPQNDEYVNTSQMVMFISQTYDKKIKMIRLFNKLIKLLNISTFNKVFGNLIYNQEISHYKKNYSIYSFRETVELSEENKKKSD